LEAANESIYLRYQNNDQGKGKKSLILKDGLHPAKDGHRVMGIYAAKLIKGVFHFA
jgi:phospholipase/lecithinase/hemolysin